MQVWSLAAGAFHLFKFNLQVFILRLFDGVFAFQSFILVQVKLSFEVLFHHTFGSSYFQASGVWRVSARQEVVWVDQAAAFYFAKVWVHLAASTLTISCTDEGIPRIGWRNVPLEVIVIHCLSLDLDINILIMIIHIWIFIINTS